MLVEVAREVRSLHEQHASETQREKRPLAHSQGLERVDADQFGIVGVVETARRTGAGVSPAPPPNISPSHSGGAGAGTLPANSAETVAGGMARHAPVLRGVGVGSDGPPWVEATDPRRARAAHRSRGSEDPRGARHEGDEFRQGRTPSGKRDDASVRASEVAAPGGGSGTGGDALGARSWRGRGERPSNYRGGRPRGLCTSSLMQRDREVQTWSHRNSGARGSWRGRNGRRGGRGYGRFAVSDRFGGRGGDIPEAGEIRPALHDGTPKASCYASDSDSSDGRIGGERRTTGAPAQRGRQLERDDFSDRERSRSPSVGQDRGSPPRQPTPPAARTPSPVPVRTAEPNSPSPPRQLVPDASPPSPFNSSVPRAPVGSLRQSPPQALPERESSEVADSKRHSSRLQQDVAPFPKAALHYVAATVSQAPQPAPSRQAPLLPRDSSSPPRRIVADPRAAASLHSGSASRNARVLPASNGSQSSAHSQKAQGGLKRAVGAPIKEVVPHQGVKRVRVSEAQPAVQAAPVFSSDDEVQEVPAKSSAGQERGEWPHESKSADCLRGGTKDGVSSASQERQQSPPPQGYPGQRDWPEYPKTVTRLDWWQDDSVAATPEAPASHLMTAREKCSPFYAPLDFRLVLSSGLPPGEDGLFMMSYYYFLQP